MLRLGINERIEISSYGRVRVEFKKQSRTCSRSVHAMPVELLSSNVSPPISISSKMTMESADSTVNKKYDYCCKSAMVREGGTGTACRELSSKRKCNVLSYYGK